MRDPDDRPQQFLGQVVDITERRKLEQELRHLAGHDPLTGLLNRRSLETRARPSRCAHAALRRPRCAAAARPRSLQDGQRHARSPAGDQLIISVARHPAREAARVGHRRAPRRRRVRDPAARGRHRRRADAWRRRSCRTSPITPPSSAASSCGDVTRERRRRAAGSAGSRAAGGARQRRPRDVRRQGGRARPLRALRLPTATTSRASRRAIGWIDRIRGALDEERFDLHAQPIVDLRSGTCRSVRAAAAHVRRERRARSRRARSSTSPSATT